MSELTCLELSVVLWAAHLLAQAGLSQLAFPLHWLFSARDKPTAPQGIIYGRAARALGNYLENFTAFIALDLALITTHQSGGVWPTIWILARIIYLPLYLFNVIYVRSVVWGVSLLAILMMLARLAWS
jgi:uncharacterized MAPEG superfamily protein